MTAPINRGADWAQTSSLTGCIYVVRKLSVGLDGVLYGGEWMWGKTVSVFVPSGEPEPVNQEP